MKINYRDCEVYVITARELGLETHRGYAMIGGQIISCGVFLSYPAAIYAAKKSIDNLKLKGV